MKNSLGCSAQRLRDCGSQIGMGCKGLDLSPFAMPISIGLQKHAIGLRAALALGAQCPIGEAHQHMRT